MGDVTLPCWSCASGSCDDVRCFAFDRWAIISVKKFAVGLTCPFQQCLNLIRALILMLALTRPKLPMSDDNDNIPKAPSPPSAPSRPEPPAPAPTIPLKTAGSAPAKPPSLAPTVQLQAGGTPTAPAPAPTVKLSTPGATGPATSNLSGGSGQALPKATVQLLPTQPMTPGVATTQPATIRTADTDDTDEPGEGASAGLSVVALVAALIVLGVQIATASIWVDGDWGKLFE